MERGMNYGPWPICERHQVPLVESLGKYGCRIYFGTIESRMLQCPQSMCWTSVFVRESLQSIGR